MPQFDMSLEELEKYQPRVLEPADFDTFWGTTITEARYFDNAPTSEPWEGPSVAVEVLDVTFPGFGGEPIRGWLSKPRHVEGPLPAVVHFVGYGGGRGLPIDHLYWANAGYAHLAVDTRGQGSTWSVGATPDPHGSGGQYPGMMTKGIEDPYNYYYRRVFTDGVRAVDYVASLPEVDRRRIAVQGGSQGGGISLAVAALSDDVAALMADVPFLCHFERATTVTDEFPYQEIVKYLATHRGSESWLFENLSYFDGVNFAKRINLPSLVSVALMDPICPPSTVFAAVNHLQRKPDLDVYPFNLHDGGGTTQYVKQLHWLTRLFG